jgi:hypothetical protein
MKKLFLSLVALCLLPIFIRTSELDQTAASIKNMIQSEEIILKNTLNDLLPLQESNIQIALSNSDGGYQSTGASSPILSPYISSELLPTLDDFDSSLLYSFIQQGFLEISKKNLILEKEILEQLEEWHSHKNILPLNPAKMHELMRLTAFLMSLALEEFSIPFNPTTLQSSRLALSWCSCMSTAQRITWTIQTLLVIAQKERSPSSQKKPFVCTSIASGTLLQEYLIIGGLIKLGIPLLTVNLIDPLYNALSTSKGKLKTDYGIHSAFLRNFTKKGTTESDYLRGEKMHLQLRLHVRAERFENKLKKLFLSIHLEPDAEWPLDTVVFWEESNDYHQRILHYKKRGKIDIVDSLLSDLVMVVDPGQEEALRTVILHHFKDLCENYTKQDFVASSLIDEDTTITTSKKTFIFKLPQPHICLREK